MLVLLQFIRQLIWMRRTGKRESGIGRSVCTYARIGCLQFWFEVSSPNTRAGIQVLDFAEKCMVLVNCLWQKYSISHFYRSWMQCCSEKHFLDFWKRPQYLHCINLSMANAKSKCDIYCCANLRLRKCCYKTNSIAWVLTWVTAS